MVDQILNDVLVPREDIIGAKSVTCRLLLASFPIVAIACSISPTTDDPTASTGPTLLLSVQPAAEAVEVSLATGVEVRFNNLISTNVRSYIALHDGDCPGPVVGGRWTRTPDGTGLDFSPFTLLIPGTEYTVHVGGCMTDGSGQLFDLRLHGNPLGGEAATGEMVLGPDGMGMGMDMMGQTISHTGHGWAHADGTYGLVFQFTRAGELDGPPGHCAARGLPTPFPPMTPVQFSTFAKALTAETAFTVLAIAKRLQATGKDVVELEIGDSPFNTSPAAKAAGIEAIESNHSRYCASPGLPELREAAARYAREQFGIPAESENVVVGSGAKVFEQFFCEAFLNPGDGVLVFSPYFPTYVPNILRRGARPVFAPLLQANDFRPDLADIERFMADDPSPKGIFLNSPHNPTGGVATEGDLRSVADLIRGKQIAVFSDEPYCHMVWKGRHHSLMAQPDMLDHGVAAYTFSKSYSMGGWRLGFAVSSPTTIERMGTMINTTLSCTPPFVQLAGRAALEHDSSERDSTMDKFRGKVGLLTDGLNRVDGFHALDPRATFYVFPNVSAVCNRLGITSHGLALYLLEGADDDFGVACLGGECFGDAGAGFLRLSCAASDERLEQALAFIPTAVGRVDRIRSFLEERPELRLGAPYPV